MIGITFGGFNPLHEGHIKLFRNAKKQCDKLIVCVDDDEHLRIVKHQEPYFTLEERIEDIMAIKYVDQVDIQSLEQTKKFLVNKYKPDVIFAGNDWNKNTFTGEGLGVKVIYLPKTEGISSTELRTKNV